MHDQVAPQTIILQPASSAIQKQILDRYPAIDSLQQMLPLQSKLFVTASDDPLEREADEMAQYVTSTPTQSFASARTVSANQKPSDVSNRSVNTPFIQKKYERCGEDVIQRKPLASFIQKKQSSQGNTTITSDTVSNKIQSAKGGGSPLESSAKSFMETRFGSDFSGVRVHTDNQAIQLSRELNAQAFTVGNDVFFNEGKYAPESSEGKHLLAHELTHTVQQGANFIQREPIFNDATCSEPLQENILDAWNVAIQWIRRARVSLGEANSVRPLLQNHFKIDPENSAHEGALDLVRDNFTQMAALIETNINNRCTPTNSDSQCRLPDGRLYDAYVHVGTPGDGIWHCVDSADAGFLGRASLIQAVVHEIAHLTTNGVIDHAYRHQGSTYRSLTQEQAIHNADSYSEFAQDVFLNRASLGMIRAPVSIGTLLSAASPQWVIRAGVDFRSFSGIEVFDIIGGYHIFMGIDGDLRSVRTLGAAFDIGVLSRSPDTHFFADTRVGVYGTFDPTMQVDPGLGPTLSATIGWANNGFRAGVNVRPMFDLLQGNHSIIIGGEFGVEF